MQLGSLYTAIHAADFLVDLRFKGKQYSMTAAPLYRVSERKEYRLRLVPSTELIEVRILQL